MALHPFTQLQMQHRRDDVVRGLLSKPKAEVDAIFERFDQTCARVDAIKAGNWDLYVQLGGDPSIVPAMQVSIDDLDY